MSRAARGLERRAPSVVARAALASFVLVVASAAIVEAHGSRDAAELTPALAPPVPGSYALPPLGSAADGSLIDSDGRRLRLHDLLGDRLVVMSFIYTSCPEATGCPLATHVLATVRARLSARPERRSGVRFVSVSFDPARDTPAAMSRYRASFVRATDGAGSEPEWRFLTSASDEEIAPLLAAYGQAVQHDIDETGAALGTISHVLRVFVIDRDKRIRNVYSASFLHAEMLAADLETLALEGASPPRDSASAAAAPADVEALLDLVRRPPRGLPDVPVPPDNPLTAAKVALGRKLFFDRRLSRNDTFSCAMCHVPAQGFTSNEIATAVGIDGSSVKRNAPTVLNVAYATTLFHDAREHRLEHQIWGPLLAANEMGNPSIGYVLDKITALPDYRGLFEAAFDGRGPSLENVGMALASYERTLLAGDSAFDRWRFGRDEAAMSASGKRGFALFTGKAGCVGCHVIAEDHALFTDYGLYHTGIGYRASRERVAWDRPSDLGRYEVTERPDDRWRYRTPTLRNVALTPPYMHDGSIATLAAVVEYYDGGGEPSELLDPRIYPLHLDREERSDLVAFLESLTAGNVAALVADARTVPVGER